MKLASCAAAAAVLALSGAARADAEPVVRAVLGEERYRFCHEKDYPLTHREHAWCPIVGDESEACPALPAACKLAPVAETGGSRGATRGAGRDERRRDPDAAPRRPEERREPRASLKAPDMSGVATALLVLLVIAFVVAIGRAIARNFVTARNDAPDPEAPPAERAALDPEEARGPVETDVERLLSRSRAAASRGDYARAIDDAYAALLRRLDGDGLIDIHPSRTNGDYVRALADRPDLRRAVRDLARDVERVQFGDVAPSEPLFRAVLDRVAPLVGRALSVVVLCFGLSAAVSCAELDTGEPVLGEASPSGAQAIADVLGKQGVAVRFRSEALTKLEDPGALLLLPGVHADDAAWAHLLGWVRDRGGHLVIAGVEPPASLGVGITDGHDAGPRLRVGWQFTAAYADVDLASPSGPRLAFTAGGDEPEGALLLRDGRGLYALRRDEGKGTVTVFADDRLFTNVALTVPANAAFLSRFFGRLPAPRTVEIADGFTGLGASTPFESVHRAALTPAVLQLLALLALLYLWRGRAFARLRDPPPVARRSFADHARALGQAYARARASRHVLGLYAAWALERLRERVHRAGRRGLVPLAEAISARTGRPEADVMRVLVDAGDARDEASPTSRSAPPARRARRDEEARDLELMQQIEGFLGATGKPRARVTKNRSA